MAKKFWVPLKDRVQSELIKRGHCVGCAKSLADADRSPYLDKEEPNKELVTCSCRRVYVYNKQINSYRRARFDELRVD